MNASRELTFLLAEPERRLLRAMAARIPSAIRPNHLTALGVLAALLAGGAYALSGRNPAWLWAASLGDAVSVAAIGTGIGLSPYVDLWVALGLVVGYLVLSINVYLETNVFGVFELGYGRLGPTESRLILIGINTLLVIVPAGLLPVPLPALVNGAFLAVLAGMGLVLATRVARNLATLAKLEPQRPRAPRPSETPHATSRA